MTDAETMGASRSLQKQSAQLISANSESPADAKSRSLLANLPVSIDVTLASQALLES